MALDELAGPGEIEITQEMIEAGEEAILRELGGGVVGGWSPDEVVALVYRAMESVRKQ